MQELFLWNTENKKIYLKEIQKSYSLFLFFPFAYTGTCTKEVCFFNPEDYPSIEILGISVDSPFCLKYFKEHSSVRIHLYSDYNRSISRYFNCLESNFLDFHNVSKRAAVCVDSNFTIIYSEILTNAKEQLNFSKLECFLKELS